MPPRSAFLGTCVVALAQFANAQSAPAFKVDPFWPKPLPNRWSMQQVTGLYVEQSNDHIWFLNRGAAADGDEIGGGGNPPRIDCCVVVSAVPSYWPSSVSVAVLLYRS